MMKTRFKENSEKPDLERSTHKGKKSGTQAKPADLTNTTEKNKKSPDESPSKPMNSSIVRSHESNRERSRSPSNKQSMQSSKFLSTDHVRFKDESPESVGRSEVFDKHKNMAQTSAVPTHEERKHALQKDLMDGRSRHVSTKSKHKSKSGTNKLNEKSGGTPNESIEMVKKSKETPVIQRRETSSQSLHKLEINQSQNEAEQSPCNNHDESMQPSKESEPSNSKVDSEATRLSKEKHKSGSSSIKHRKKKTKDLAKSKPVSVKFELSSKDDEVGGESSPKDLSEKQKKSLKSKSSEDEMKEVEDKSSRSCLNGEEKLKKEASDFQRKTTRSEMKRPGHVKKIHKIHNEEKERSNEFSAQNRSKMTDEGKDTSPQRLETSPQHLITTKPKVKKSKSAPDSHRIPVKESGKSMRLTSTSASSKQSTSGEAFQNSTIANSKEAEVGVESDIVPARKAKSLKISHKHDNAPYFTQTPQSSEKLRSETLNDLKLVPQSNSEDASSSPPVVEHDATIAQPVNKIALNSKAFENRENSSALPAQKKVKHKQDSTQQPGASTLTERSSATSSIVKRISKLSNKLVKKRSRKHRGKRSEKKYKHTASYRPPFQETPSSSR